MCVNTALPLATAPVACTGPVAAVVPAVVTLYQFVTLGETPVLTWYKISSKSSAVLAWNASPTNGAVSVIVGSLK